MGVSAERSPSRSLLVGIVIAPASFREISICDIDIALEFPNALGCVERDTVVQDPLETQVRGTGLDAHVSTQVLRKETVCKIVPHVVDAHDGTSDVFWNGLDCIHDIQFFR